MEVALTEFGTHGLDGASTRKIASAAGTAMSAITYHYGSKEGLYLATADYIAARMQCDMAERFGDEPAIADDDAAGARARIQLILRTFAEKMTMKAIDEWSLFLVREQMRPTEAFARIYDGLMGRLAETLCRLIRIVTGCSAERARIVTLTLIGQVVMFRAGRATCLRLLDRAGVDDALLTEIQAILALNIDAILDAMIAQPEAAA